MIFTILTSVIVSFNLNTGNPADTLQSMKVEPGSVIALAEKPVPSREGYRFAGWYTSPECLPDQEWHFGEKSGSMWPQKTIVDSMPVEGDMTLYARWTSPVHIGSVKELQEVEKDLYGWYILDRDLDLKDIRDWDPIGYYDASYEWCDGEWWTLAFKGRFDGNGHTIRNLQIRGAMEDKAALFGAVADAEIENLTLKKVVIDIRNGNGATFVAPLISLAKQDRSLIIRNCHVKKASIKVKADIAEGMYFGATGLICGIWNGQVENCSIDGKIKVELTGKGGGMAYIGGLTGETYCNNVRCISSMDVDAKISPEISAEAFVGGLASSCTFISDGVSFANVKVRGGSQDAKINIGGITGDVRYGTIERCEAFGKLAVASPGRVRLGGVVGSFSETFGALGVMTGVNETLVRACRFSGKLLPKKCPNLQSAPISAIGTPDPLTFYGQPIMTYKVFE